MRVELENTVLKLKSKHFAPIGASKAHKLELIKSKRGAEQHSRNNSSHKWSHDEILQSSSR